VARTYRRDSRGRFAGGGGGSGGGGSKGGGKGGGSKSANTRKANTARASELRDKGTTGIGGRVKAKGFEGGKGAQDRAGGLRRGGTAQGRGPAFTVNRTGGQSGAQKAATSKAVKKLARAKSRSTNPPARTNKSPVSPAKTRYKELSGKARKTSAFRTTSERREAAGARRSLQSMVNKRGR
jgi:hypothetical protein